MSSSEITMWELTAMVGAVIAFTGVAVFSLRLFVLVFRDYGVLIGSLLLAATGITVFLASYLGSWMGVAND